jgi:hypothetical protein
MPVLGWHGDPCVKCEDRAALGLIPRAARYGDLCTRCFLAATPAQRALALLTDRQERMDWLQARFALYCIERDAATLMADLAEFGGETA